MSKRFIVLIVLAILSFTVMGLNASQQETEKIGENKLIYSVKYVDGVSLTKLVYEYLKGTPGTGVDYVNELRTIIVTAPKDTHSIIRNLLNQFDVPSATLRLHCYLLQNLQKGVTKTATEKSLKPVLGSIMLTMPDKNYQLVGDGSIWLSSGNQQYNSEIVITPDEVAGDDMIYRISIGKTEVVGDVARFNNFGFYAEEILAPAAKQEKAVKETQNIIKLMNQNFSIKTGEFIVLGSVTAKSKLKKELLLVVVLEEIKGMVISSEPVESSILLRKGKPYEEISDAELKTKIEKEIKEIKCNFKDISKLFGEHMNDFGGSWGEIEKTHKCEDVLNSIMPKEKAKWTTDLNIITPEKGIMTGNLILYGHYMKPPFKVELDEKKGTIRVNNALYVGSEFQSEIIQALSEKEIKTLKLIYETINKYLIADDEMFIKFSGGFFGGGALQTMKETLFIILSDGTDFQKLSYLYKNWGDRSITPNNIKPIIFNAKKDDYLFLYNKMVDKDIIKQ